MWPFRVKHDCVCKLHLLVLQPGSCHGRLVADEADPARLEMIRKLVAHSLAGLHRDLPVLHPGSMAYRLDLNGERNGFLRIMRK